MKPSFWTIRTAELGRRMSDTSTFLYLTEPGVPLEIAYRVWVLECFEELILVDTGPPLAEGLQRGLQQIVDVVDALARMGIAADSIETVLLTHLHWDHAANANSFPNAIFYAQQSEIEFYLSAKRQHPAFNRFFSANTNLTSMIESGRIIGLPGNHAFRPGVEVFRVGGHTPGSQMVGVSTEIGYALITGDAIPLFRNFSDSIPSGILSDVSECIAALDMVEKRKPSVIYPGHDIEPAWKIDQRTDS